MVDQSVSHKKKFPKKKKDLKRKITHLRIQIFH